MSDLPPGVLADPQPLRRCPGCGNQVTRQTPRCPVCGKHAVAARLASAARWAVIAAGMAGLAWWGLHR